VLCVLFVWTVWCSLEFLPKLRVRMVGCLGSSCVLIAHTWLGPTLKMIDGIARSVSRHRFDWILGPLRVSLSN
jgi:hypothetical protein